jgi:uncharacterized repeat protein (TIGR03803 family)
VGGRGAACGAYCTADGGTIFSLDLRTGTETVVHSFCAQSKCDDGAIPIANLINVNGTLYGTTAYGGADNNGTVFAFNPDTDTERVLYSFCSPEQEGPSEPFAGLIDVDGILYGTTVGSGCGGEGNGAVFSIDPKTGAESVIYYFTGGTDGQGPFAALIDVNGVLYGTTGSGGTYGEGTVFALTKKQ